MSYRVQSYWLVLLACAYALVGVAAAETLNPPFWRVSGESGTAYLLGSVHFGDESMYPLPAAVTEAYQASDALVVEVNPLDPGLGGGARMLLENAVYSDGTTLRDHVGQETWRVLEKMAEKKGYPVEAFRPQKPWFVALTLTALEFRRAGYREDLGIDYHFIQRASGENKPILELESFAQQLGIFDMLSEKEQETFLVQTLEEIEKGSDYLNGVIDAWKSGDTDKIDALLNESFKTPETRRIYQLLFIDRNEEMARKIEGLLNRGGTYFVVVGAGHLVSEQGIVRLLQERGHRVEVQGN